MLSLISSMPGPFSGRLALQILAVATPCLTGGLSVAAAFPTPPQSFDATYAAPTARMINVAAGGNFQTALDKAQLGDTIVLQAGATYTGPFTLPNKTAGTGWIYVISNTYASLPAPGKRVGPSDAANMPKIASPANNNALVTVANSRHFRFVGVEFVPAVGAFVYNLISIGNADISPA